MVAQDSPNNAVTKRGGAPGKGGRLTSASPKRAEKKREGDARPEASVARTSLEKLVGKPAAGKLATTHKQKCSPRRHPANNVNNSPCATIPSRVPSKSAVACRQTFSPPPPARLQGGGAPGKTAANPPFFTRSPPDPPLVVSPANGKAALLPDADDPSSCKSRQTRLREVTDIIRRKRQALELRGLTKLNLQQNTQNHQQHDEGQPPAKGKSPRIEEPRAAGASCKLHAGDAAADASASARSEMAQGDSSSSLRAETLSVEGVFDAPSRAFTPSRDAQPRLRAVQSPSSSQSPSAARSKRPSSGSGATAGSPCRTRFERNGCRPVVVAPAKSPSPSPSPCGTPVAGGRSLRLSRSPDLAAARCVPPPPPALELTPTAGVAEEGEGELAARRTSTGALLRNHAVSVAVSGAALRKSRSPKSSKLSVSTTPGSSHVFRASRSPTVRRSPGLDDPSTLNRGTFECKLGTPTSPQLAVGPSEAATPSIRSVGASPARSNATTATATTADVPPPPPRQPGRLHPHAGKRVLSTSPSPSHRVSTPAKAGKAAPAPADAGAAEAAKGTPRDLRSPSENGCDAPSEASTPSAPSSAKAKRAAARPRGSTGGSSTCSSSGAGAGGDRKAADGGELLLAGNPQAADSGAGKGSGKRPAAARPRGSTGGSSTCSSSGAGGDRKAADGGELLLAGNPQAADSRDGGARKGSGKRPASEKDAPHHHHHHHHQTPGGDAEGKLRAKRRSLHGTPKSALQVDSRDEAQPPPPLLGEEGCRPCSPDDDNGAAADADKIVVGGGSVDAKASPLSKSFQTASSSAATTATAAATTNPRGSGASRELSQGLTESSAGGGSGSSVGTKDIRQILNESARSARAEAINGGGAAAHPFSTAHAPLDHHALRVEPDSPVYSAQASTNAALRVLEKHLSAESGLNASASLSQPSVTPASSVALSNSKTCGKPRGSSPPSSAAFRRSPEAAAKAHDSVPRVRGSSPWGTGESRGEKAKWKAGVKTSWELRKADLARAQGNLSVTVTRTGSGLEGERSEKSNCSESAVSHACCLGGESPASGGLSFSGLLSRGVTTPGDSQNHRATKHRTVPSAYKNQRHLHRRRPEVEVGRVDHLLRARLHLPQRRAHAVAAAGRRQKRDFAPEDRQREHRRVARRLDRRRAASRGAVAVLPAPDERRRRARRAAAHVFERNQRPEAVGGRRRPRVRHLAQQRDERGEHVVVPAGELGQRVRKDARRGAGPGVAGRSAAAAADEVGAAGPGVR
ncbi:hypothetical protein DIPPA_08859 [Diplonema papillatum]|nr:hypothetical protein DIPPA_08859 [Diplonema papillatum]